MVAVNRKAVKQASKDVKPKVRTDKIDIYMRMNEDPEKDYCFNVPANAKVSSLYKIFDVLPINLSPSYFCEDRPSGFAASVHPGYMTAEGALLFSGDAHYKKWQKPLSDDALIGDVIAEGQLIIPVWKTHRRRKLLTLLFLAVWLYLDLPEFISPTPGTAPSRFLFWFAKEFVFEVQPIDDDSMIYHPYFQLAFFAGHILKVGIIYLILWNGVWHPNSLNPLAPKKGFKTPKHEQLSEIGWTGARRLRPVKWENKYLDHIAKRAGGLVEAYRKGELTKVKGYMLSDGEGWNVLANQTLDDVVIEDDLLDKEGKFVVSRPYFLELAKPLSQMISNGSTSTDDQEMIRNFRSYGYLDGPKLLEELFTDLIPMHTKKK